MPMPVNVRETELQGVLELEGATKRYGALTVITWVFVFGSLMTLPLGGCDAVVANAARAAPREREVDPLACDCRHSRCGRLAPRVYHFDLRPRRLV